MPVMNNLKILLQSRGIENPNQFRVATQEADSEKKGIAPGTALTAWNDRLWVPSATTLRLICKTFQMQPGDFLYYASDEAIKNDKNVAFPVNINALPSSMTFSDAIVIAKRLGLTLETLAENLSISINSSQ